MDQRKFINFTRITTSAFDNVLTNLTTQQMASNFSFEGQLPMTLSRDTLPDSGSDILVDSSNEPITYFFVFCFLGLTFGVLFGSYMFVQSMRIIVLESRQRKLKLKLDKINWRVDKLDLRIQMKDMEIKMSEIEMKVDALEGKVDEKLTQERLDHQVEMLDWKAQAQKEKDDSKLEKQKEQEQFDRNQRRLERNFFYIQD